jgi:ribosome-binding protein aMBF1 (putative translation factor)
MKLERAKECWPSWDGQCEVCGSKVSGEVTRDGDFRLVHPECAVGAQDVSEAAAVLGRKGGKVSSPRKTAAVRENAKRKRSNRKTGYRVWLFGDSYWHKTLEGAQKRSREALNWCNGEHNQIIEVATGNEIHQLYQEHDD